MAKKRDEIKKEDKWVLTDLISDNDEAEQIKNDISSLVDQICTYKGNIIDKLFDVLELYTKAELLNEKLYVYTYLKYYEDMANNDSKSRKELIDKFEEDFSLRLSWLSPELLSHKYDEILEIVNKDKRLDKYRFYLEKEFRYQKYSLSEAEEAIISAASNAFGTGSEVFDAIDNVDINLGEVILDGKVSELTQANYITLIKNEKQENRKIVFEKLYEYYKNLNNTITSAYVGTIKESFFFKNVRKFSSPLAMSLYSDNLDEKIYDNLINIVHEYLPSMYKYMALKKKYLKLKDMHMYDIYMPIGRLKEENISFDEGKKILFSALKVLGEDYLKDLDKAFSDGWIDKYENKNKRSGAYEWGAYQSHPYVSLNYVNDYNSVDTLGHELGHAMHSYYSNKNNEFIYAGYPIFLAEIASTTNETFIDDWFLKNAKSIEEKIYYLGNFLEKVRTTIFRQTMFAEFERMVFDKYQNNVALTSDELNNTYLNLNKLYYGDNVISDDYIKFEWSRIPHFYTPFYVFKYATGLSVALSINSKIMKDKNYSKKYINSFLSAGSSSYPLDILKKCDIDLVNGEAITEALDLFKNKVDELEKLIN